MKLLKRLLSFGGKKSNKKHKPNNAHDVPLPEPTWLEPTPLDHDEHEAAIGRILRTSSARHRESRTIEHPPMLHLPQPANTVLSNPMSSSVSIASTTISQRGTYNVTVHQRKHHASTEFPNANRDKDKPSKENRNSLAAKEDSRILRLRSDPSVVSLIELYDDHGKIAADAFANDSTSSEVPINEGRAQCKRSGSTLRQLLGFPTPVAGQDNSEGDISWAERVLGETEGSSLNSSMGLHTPIDSRINHEVSFVSDVDMSMMSEIDNPAISSMEVELSLTSNTSKDETDTQNIPYIHVDPNTPQRASQVFDFITRGKQSTKPTEERELPQLPSTFSSPSDENASQFNPKSRFSTTTSDFTFVSPSSARISQAGPDTTPKKLPQPRFAFASETPRPSTYTVPTSAFSDDSHAPVVPDTVKTPPTLHGPDVKVNDVHVLMTGPTKVILTAATPSTNPIGPSRSLHGPRSIPRKSSGGHRRRRSALTEVSNGPSQGVDPFLAQPPDGKRATRRRSGSDSSMRSAQSVEEVVAVENRSKMKKSEFFTSASPRRHKENQLGLSVKTEIPATPLRSNTTPSRPRSLMRTAVHQNMNIFRPPKDVILPSPASSSEMSPVGRKMMTDVREQRMKAREADRERSARRHDRNVMGRF
ncbi:hypothetical protein CVT24_009803 [Panaeolus cyanescens]|uniref:Uncharacterized protein n=1 Tax=Panaeolus cyanescens TaxID=181874 RepID=A0A409VAD2_9AGAR|nr:hypothetical protein CVT24_009803 [Panaeolus cyanescens]